MAHERAHCQLRCCTGPNEAAKFFYHDSDTQTIDCNQYGVFTRRKQGPRASLWPARRPTTPITRSTLSLAPLKVNPLELSIRQPYLPSTSLMPPPFPLALSPEMDALVHSPISHPRSNAKLDLPARAYEGTIDYMMRGPLSKTRRKNLSWRFRRRVQLGLVRLPLAQAQLEALEITARGASNKIADSSHEDVVSVDVLKHAAERRTRLKRYYDRLPKFHRPKRLSSRFLRRRAQKLLTNIPLLETEVSVGKEDWRVRQSPYAKSGHGLRKPLTSDELDWIAAAPGSLPTPRDRERTGGSKS